MTILDKLRMRETEIKGRNADIALLEGDGLTDEIRTEQRELTTEYRDLQTSISAAEISDPTVEVQGAPNAEQLEFQRLVDGSNLGDVARGVIEKRAVDGETAELQQHYGLGANQFPIDLLRAEHRAVTVAPTATEAGQQPIVQPVFGDGDADFLMVSQTVVEQGSAVFPVLTNRPTVGGPHTNSTVVAETTGTFSADALDPGSLRASFFYRDTDAARFPGLDAALRQALSSGLSEAVDASLIDRIVADVGRTDAVSENTFASYRSALVYSQLDGRHASMEDEIRLLAGSPTLSHMSGKYRGNNADDSAVDSLRRISGGLKVSPHIAGVASHKQDVIVRKGTLADAAIGLWRGMSLIDDPFSKSSKGEHMLTGVLLAAFKITRTSGFARVQVQHQ